MHQDNLFVTLTYAPEHEPADRSVSPRELQLFLKRLRRNVEPTFQHEKQIQDAWPYGFIVVGTLSSGSASYVAGYVTKDDKIAGLFESPDRFVDHEARSNNINELLLISNIIINFIYLLYHNVFIKFYCFVTVIKAPNPDQ